MIGHRDVVGRALLDALPELQGQGFKKLLDEVRDSGNPWVGRETAVELQRTPGAPVETRYLDMVFQPFVEADGRRTGVVAHGSDVTDHVLARRELEQANERLEETAAKMEMQAEELKSTSLLRERAIEAESANRAKMDFLTVMSHELRTPLNAIGGYTALLELGIHGPVTADQRTSLERIQRSQRHLLGLINGVLNFAKVDAGAVTYENNDVHLAEVLATCESLISPQVRMKQLVLVNRGGSAGAAVRADREKVEQIILNLLTNAVKFTDAGGRIELAYDIDAMRARVIVSDTACGIAADQLARVFEPFVQVDAALTRTHEGAGLGLAISRDLARGMGGDLCAESQLGKGSAFTLMLPV